MGLSNVMLMAIGGLNVRTSRDFEWIALRMLIIYSVFLGAPGDEPFRQYASSLRLRSAQGLR